MSSGVPSSPARQPPVCPDGSPRCARSPGGIGVKQHGCSLVVLSHTPACFRESFWWGERRLGFPFAWRFELWGITHCSFRLRHSKRTSV